MSSVRGQTSRGRGRGSMQQAPSRGRGASNTRGRVFGGSAQRATTASGGSFGQPSRQNANRAPRAASRAASNAATAHGQARLGTSGFAKTTGTWEQRFEALKEARIQEKEDAIRRGLIEDPKKPRALSEAITPVGTCQHMCAEHERVRRVVQDEVWDEETEPSFPGSDTKDRQPTETRMVKKFIRAGAGDDAQLPSDLRPPPILQRTCDYLFNDLIGNAPSLAHVHHFVWDRTRAIRNDFSIQQLTKLEDLRIAIDCYERIARFHIASLHQLATPEKPYSQYDWKQETEQLDRTLVSLMLCYEDTRGRIDLPNEAEFRAYAVIYQLQDLTPDLEDRIQTRPRHVVQDARVRKAMDVYMAACNIQDAKGPFSSRATQLIARQDWQRFWSLIASKATSYLMACVAEVYFNLVRRMVLNALFRTSRANTSNPTSEWTIDLLCEILAFDHGDEVQAYCERFGFAFNEREDGEQYLDLNSVRGKTLPAPKAGMPMQTKTSLVEDKRCGRTMPAIINGLAVKQAQEAGMVIEDDGEMEDIESVNRGSGAMDGVDGDVVDDGESLFIPESQPTLPNAGMPASTSNGIDGSTNTPWFLAGNAGGNGSTFGRPSNSGESPFNFASSATESNQNEQSQDPVTGGLKFDFTKPAPTTSTFNTASAPLFSMDAQNNAGTSSDTKKDDAKTGVLFARPAQDSNSIFSAAGTKTPNAPTSLFQNLGSTAPTTTSADQNGMLAADQTSSSTLPSSDPETESPSPEQPKNRFTFGPPSGAPAASMPSQHPETKVSQPHFTGSPTSPTIHNTSANQQSPLPGGSLGLRRQSDTRPKKPSPLSNSFSANDESSSTQRERVDPTTTPHQVNGIFATQQSQAVEAPPIATQSFAKASNLHASEDVESIVSRVAEEFFNAPVGGILDQYIDFHVRRTITEVQNQLETETLNKEADDYRQFTLCLRYGRRWRDVFWQRKLVKSGRQRRQRRQRRLEERGNQESETASLLDNESIFGSSRAGSAFGDRNDSSRFGTTMGSFWSAPTTNDQQALAGSKRPTSSHGAERMGPPRQSGHKRLKSTSHIDDRGRVAKPSVASHPHADILKRSSFLGFSLSPDATNNKNTTTSNYFRLKAMGVHRATASFAPRGTKRGRSDSLQTASQTSPPALRSLSPSTNGFSLGQADGRALMPPPSSAPSQTHKTKDDDEALFARLKAARENLEKSTIHYQSETGTDNELGRSLNSSQSSSGESPSLARARADARLRASQSTFVNGASALARNVPAYRMRESRFVPREQYGLAIERANNIRASRSRETSRPESRVAQNDTKKEISKPATPPASLEFARSKTSDQTQASKANASGQNGYLQSTAPQVQVPSLAAASDSFASFTPKAPISFASHTTQLADHNPFLQSNNSDLVNNVNVDSSLDPFAVQPSFASDSHDHPATGTEDHTIRPSQINQALANSFGSSHGQGQNHAFSLSNYGAPQAQQNSYLASQTISLLSDDGEDNTPDVSANDQHGGVEPDEEVEELPDEATDDEEYQNPYAHTNPYMALAHDRDEDQDEIDEQGWQSQVEDAAEYDEDRDEEPNGYGDDESEDHEGIDGDIDEDETEDADEEDDENGYNYGFADNDDGSQWQHQEYAGSWTGQAVKDPALQEVGNTADDAIELSD